MIGRFIRIPILFLLFTGIEFLILFFLSLFNSESLIIEFSLCVTREVLGGTCSTASNYLYLAIIIAVNIFLSLYFSNNNIFEEKYDWKKTAKDRLGQIQKNYSSDDIIKVKHSLIEVDKILDFVTQKKGIKGKDYYARIGNLDSFLTRDEIIRIKSARKLRNKIVHEIGFEPEMKSLKESFWNIRNGIIKLIK
ncbi:MAG TPA: hypothetical protein VGA67_05155 [Candidatus Dojkabacteria bacterium]